MDPQFQEDLLDILNDLRDIEESQVRQLEENNQLLRQIKTQLERLDGDQNFIG